MVIEVEQLVKTYGPVRAVDGISFKVKQGEVFGMLGPNGAGKTTTVEIIEGLRQADSGRVTVLGMDVAKVPARIKQKIGIQLQAPSLLPLLTTEEILNLFGGLYEKNQRPLSRGRYEGFDIGQRSGRNNLDQTVARNLTRPHGSRSLEHPLVFGLDRCHADRKKKRYLDNSRLLHGWPLLR
jgi:ABC-type sugar transport system ATPase subunit